MWHKSSTNFDIKTYDLQKKTYDLQFQENIQVNYAYSLTKMKNLCHQLWE